MPRPAGWLEKLSYAEAKAELTGFFGIGEKIADCISLFGLGLTLPAGGLLLR